MSILVIFDEVQRCLCQYSVCRPAGIECSQAEPWPSAGSIQSMSVVVCAYGVEFVYKTRHGRCLKGRDVVPGWLKGTLGRATSCSLQMFFLVHSWAKGKSFMMTVLKI